ncbi:hypothetical protein HG530_002963 [Fusarium avenaceum]|nr:hypothetical protein HG530_002963 [Fusarium avenaceum]
MEQNTTWRGDMESSEEFGVEQRQLNHLLQLVNVALQTTNLAEVYVQVNTKRVVAGHTRKQTTGSRRRWCHADVTNYTRAVDHLVVTAVRIHAACCASTPRPVKKGTGTTASKWSECSVETAFPTLARASTSSSCTRLCCGSLSLFLFDVGGYGVTFWGWHRIRLLLVVQKRRREILGFYGCIFAGCIYIGSVLHILVDNLFLLNILDVLGQFIRLIKVCNFLKAALLCSFLNRLGSAFKALETTGGSRSTCKRLWTSTSLINWFALGVIFFDVFVICVGLDIVVISLIRQVAGD